MDHTTYLTLTAALLGGALISSLLAVLAFVWWIASWRGARRNRRILASAAFMVLAGALLATQMAVYRLVFRPHLLENARAIRSSLRSQAFVGDSSGTKTDVGDTAPGFTLILDNGSNVKLGSMHGDVVLLNFFGTHCGPCLAELPHIQDLWDQYGDRDDFHLLVLGRDETGDSVARFQKEHGFSFPMAADRDGKVFQLYAAEGIPRTYVIARDGTIAYQSLGFQDSTDDCDDLERLHAGLRQALYQPD